MSKTLAEIGYSIRNQVIGYFGTDDTRISMQFVYDKAWDVRSMLIKEEYRKFKQLNDQDYVSECCIEICCSETVCDGDDSLFSEKFITLPVLTSALGYNGVKYFGSVDKKNPFRRTNYGGYMYSDYNKYTKKAPTYTLVDDKAYLKNLPTDTMKYICVIGIFENPKDYCKPEDPFPLARHLVHKLEMIVIQQLLSTINIGPDQYNNAHDDAPMPVNPQNNVPNSG